MPDTLLTPAEAYVLLDPDGASSREAFKIVLFELVAMGVLEVAEVEKRVLFMRRGTKPVVSVVREPPPLFLAAEIVDVVRSARSSEHGCDFLALAHSAYKKVLLGASDLVICKIGPALVAGGWLEATGGHPRFRHTPAGLAETQRLQSWLDRARQLPARGPLLLRVPELGSPYQPLAARDADLLDQGFAEFEAYFDGSRYS